MIMLAITQLWVYPIKSCQGVSLNHVDCLPSGLRHDREMMIIDERGRFVTQRSDAILAHIEVALPDETHVELGFSGRRLRFAKQYQQAVSAEVWRREVPGFDQGDAVADFLSQIIGRSVRLIATRPLDTQSAEKQILFQDGQALHILSEASLAHAQQQLPHVDIDARRFRPNIVIGEVKPRDDTSAISAFAEDNWHSIDTPTTAITISKLCERCNIPSIHPDTLTVDKAVGAYFKTHRMIERRPMFGVCGGSVLGGQLSVGDKITAKLKQQ